jgi:oligopeptide transport system substrate-binding protein
MKKVSVFILLIIIILTLTNCSREEEKAAEELPHFIFGDKGSTESLDPRYASGEIEQRIHFALFEGLVTYDPKTLEPIPGVAEKWDISEDGITYTFYLRKDAHWSDGTPVTAQQFEDTWLDLLKNYRFITDLYMIKGAEEFHSGNTGPDAVAIRALDDFTFQFDLTGPVPYALTLLSDIEFIVLPIHVLEKYGNQWTEPEFFVGNGPFVLDHYIPGDRIVVRKSETYWDKKNVHLGQITTLFIEDEDIGLEMYQAGELDWYCSHPGGQLTNLLNTPYVHLNPTITTYFYRFNMRIPPLDDSRIRTALTISINRRELIDTVLEGSKFPAFGITPPLSFYPAVVGFEEDIERARALIAEAGYANGEGFPELVLSFNDEGEHRKIAEYVQKKWSENLGVEVKLKGLEWSEFLERFQKHDFEIQRGGWYGHYLDPNTFLEPFVTDNEWNFPGMSNSEYDALIKKAGRMKSGQERFDVLREAEEILIGQEMAIMPFYYYVNMNLINTEVWGGWYENVMDWHPWKGIYKKEL